MAMVMATATDTAMVRRIRKNKVYLLVLTLLVIKNNYAADLTITPSVATDVIYTNNVDLTASNEKSSEITSLIAGLDIQSDGNDGNLSLNYQLEQLLYSYNSDKNKLYNTLSFSADKGLFSQTNIRGSLSASIVNVANNIQENASTDVATGNTVETRNAGVGFSYQSNPSGIVDLYTSIDGTVTNNDDGVGDNNSYTGSIIASQGSSVKTLLWSTNYDYETSVGRNDEKRTESTELTQEVGLQQMNGFSPYLRLYYEDYSGQTGGDSADSSNWGPGLKYYLDRHSYVDVGYDFSLDDDVSDSIRGGLYLNPTDRTSFDFEYTKRFYGDAYSARLTHENRRLTNSITYEEEVTNYNRELYILGNQISQLTISKTLAWNSSLSLRRSTVNLDVSTQKQQSFSDLSANTDVDVYSGTLSISHRLTRDSTISPGFTFEYYDFFSQGQETQEDYYRKWSLKFTHKFARDLSMNLGFSYDDRSSTEKADEYQESRVNVNVKKEF